MIDYGLILVPKFIGRNLTPTALKRIFESYRASEQANNTHSLKEGFGVFGD